jgi:hypothetical protein
MPEKAILFGNCQAYAMASILSDHKPFTDRFSIIKTKAVHALSPPDREKLLRDVEGADLFIHQPVSDVYRPASTERLLSALRPAAKAISFPVSWFDAYFPDMTYLKAAGKKATTPLFDYPSRIFIHAYRAGRQAAGAAEIYSRLDLYDPQSLEEIARKNVTTLRAREQRLDIKIASYVETNFREKCLFFTINHPTGHLLYFKINAILRLLGIEQLAPEVKRKHSSILGAFRWKACPSAYRGLRLGFAGQPFFTSHNQHLNDTEMAEHYYSFYDADPALVEVNAGLGAHNMRLPTPV